jgi:pimeloyl-ACP methyl ester carboxylesterase
MIARVRRILATAGAALTFLVLAGATYQGVATALERRAFPHPGRLVDAGGHQLHIHCEGNGAPVVVLEAPAGGMSAAWGWVQSRVAEDTRVCSYDRAGLGWSEAGDLPYEPLAVAEHLRALLQKAGEPGPYIVAGHELGAALALLYASQFGDEVSTLLLIDMPGPGRTELRARAARVVSASPWLARTGVLRATRMLSRRAAGLPDASAGALRTFLNRPDHLTRAAREIARWDETVSTAARAPLRPGLPIVRLETGLGEFSFLTNPAQAGMVSAALEAAVARVRASRAPSAAP